MFHRRHAEPLTVCPLNRLTCDAVMPYGNGALAKIALCGEGWAGACGSREEGKRSVNMKGSYLITPATFHKSHFASLHFLSIAPTLHRPSLRMPVVSLRMPVVHSGALIPSPLHCPSSLHHPLVHRFSHLCVCCLTAARPYSHQTSAAAARRRPSRPTRPPGHVHRRLRGGHATVERRRTAASTASLLLLADVHEEADDEA